MNMSQEYQTHFWLEISVNDALLVHGVESGDKAAHDGGSSGLSEALMLSYAL